MLLITVRDEILKAILKYDNSLRQTAAKILLKYDHNI